MHTFIIRTIGKPHEDWQKEAIHSLVTKLKPFSKIEIVELAEGHEGSTKPNEAKTRRTEAETLLSNLPKEATLITLDETGTNLSSIKFAERIREWSDGGRPLVFFIGGSWGVDPLIRERAHFVLSLGKHTLPHLLARITLLEQLYRVETILCGKTYHK